MSANPAVDRDWALARIALALGRAGFDVAECDAILAIQGVCLACRGQGFRQMGCDIHLAIEIATTSGGWRVWACPNLRRDYELFGLMAGVRRPEMALFSARGYPDDSELTDRSIEEASIGEVQHSRSWLTRIEFQTVVRKYREVESASESTLRECEMILGAMAHAVEARIVFGFDN